MTQIYFADLRRRLVLLFFFATVPTLALAPYINAEQQRLAVTSAQNNALLLAHFAASNQDSLVDGAQQLLVTLSQLPQIHDNTPDNCSALLATLIKQYKQYTNFFVSDLKGNVWCSALSSTKPSSVNDRDYFKRALERNTFTVGEYQVGRTTGKAVLPLALPVHDAAGTVYAVVMTGLDLTWLNQMVSQAQLPDGSSLSIIDRNGTLLAQFPMVAGQAGKALSQTALYQAMSSSKERGILETADQDGIQRIYAFTTLNRVAQPGEIYVAVGIPSAVAYAPANQARTNYLIGVAVATILAFAATWVGSSLIIFRPVTKLIEMTQRLAAGDLSARANLHNESGMLGKLATAFDGMAHSLDQRTTQLQAAEARYRTIVDTAQEGIWIIDSEAKTTYVNPRMADMLGYTVSEMLGRSMFDFIDEAARLEATQNFERRKRGITEQHDFRFTRKDGSALWAMLATNPTYDTQGNFAGSLAMCSDITDRVQAEKELRSLYAELEQRVVARTTQLEAANKELEAFSYSVSHDLRAPLRAVNGFAHILLDDYGPQLPAECIEYLQLISHGGLQMGRLIDDLLRFSRLSRQPIQKQPVDLEALVQGTIEDLGQVKTEIVLGSLPPGAGDPGLLRQVFANLLQNAVKFTRNAESPRIEIGSQTQNGTTVYYVKDNGAGFDMQYADKLFGVFQRLHQADDYEGTGVGLAIVQRVIHRHGGKIWAEAVVNQGATFYFSLGADSNDK